MRGEIGYDELAHCQASLDRGSCTMRLKYDVCEIEQLPGHVRFIDKYVEGCRSEPPFGQGRYQFLLIDHAAARHIDQYPFGSKRIKHRFADDAVRLRAAGCGYHQEITI